MVEIINCIRGVLITGEYDHIALQKKFTCSYINIIKDKKFTKKMFGFKLYKNIPIYCTSVLKYISHENVVDKRPQIQNCGYKCNIIPMNNQKIVLDYLTNNIYNVENKNKGLSSCILVMGTGCGKTYTSGILISILCVPTLIIVPSISILKEWRKMLNYFEDSNIGEYYEKKKVDGNIVVITIDSALSENFYFEDKKINWITYFKKFGMVIYDEIHNYPTNKYQEIFWRTNFQYKLGLTATPDERLDKMDNLYKWHMNEVVFSEKILNEEKNDNWKGVVTVIQYYGPLEYTQKISNKDGWTMTTKMCQQFSDDIYRNTIILNCINDMLKRHRNVYVFAEHRDFVSGLSEKIENSGILMGGITDEEYADTLNKSVIFVTYGYGKEGISIPKMNAIIFAHPRKSKMRQIIGRILRYGGDQSIVREIVDIVDMNTSLKSQYYERKKIYIEKEFDIEMIKIKFSEINI